MAFVSREDLLFRCSRRLSRDRVLRCERPILLRISLQVIGKLTSERLRRDA